MGLGVRDGGSHQLGELGQADLGVGRKGLRPRPDDRGDAPQPAIHADRGADRRPEPHLGGNLGHRAGRVAEVVHAHRSAGGSHQGVNVVPGRRHVRADGERMDEIGFAPCPDYLRAVVLLIAAENGEIDIEEPPDLGGDGIEHLFGGSGASDERRHLAQRRLLLGIVAQLHLCLRTCDGGSHQFGEPGQPFFGVGRQGLRSLRGHTDLAPQAPTDVDRHADDRADPPLQGNGSVRAVVVAVVIDPRRTTRGEHEGVDVGAGLLQ